MKSDSLQKADVPDFAIKQIVNLLKQLKKAKG